VSAIYVTEKTFLECLYLVPGLSAGDRDTHSKKEKKMTVLSPSGVAIA